MIELKVMNGLGALEWCECIYTLDFRTVSHFTQNDKFMLTAFRAGYWARPEKAVAYGPTKSPKIILRYETCISLLFSFFLYLGDIYFLEKQII